ncbi:hypothetical protein SaccyDRAFT_1658 [Saccharomonospora cyanea NA-134]|uniref:Uncharacterized protein n=1 Tax=Saccharomonospora cyanea NA-134 TaxID=882082 RepID=H5XGL7_9PSEU|nr:hypothetical protein SaccyDRAFT_1658 [Saccharomonospora cyanea NA-134]
MGGQAAAPRSVVRSTAEATVLTEGYTVRPST